MRISRPAVEIIQGNLKLYLTYLTPRDLDEEGFYEVDKLDATPGASKGYQRILNERRVGALDRYLREAHEHGYANLPTTVFLATEGKVRYNEDKGVISFDTKNVCPFNVVDGQHRIEGLRRASRTDNDLRSFRLPVTIATGLDEAHQMYHFFVVNTTQVPVDQSLQQQIAARFEDMNRVEKLPYIPHWLQHRVHTGRDQRALQIVTKLNTHRKSPMKGRIQMANDPEGGRNKIKQSSIVKIIQDQVLTSGNPLEGNETSADVQGNILLNLWIAIDKLFVDGRNRDDTVIYKSNGLFWGFGISRWVFNVLYSSTDNFTVDSITKTIQQGLDELPDEAAAIASPDWWLSGGGRASALNRANARVYIEAFRQGLAKARNREIRV